MTEGKKDQKQKVQVKTFAVPFALGEIQENITRTINSNSNFSKEKIINKAFKFHSQGNILEAAKYYKYLINQGFKDSAIFFNYGVILKDIGKLKDAEIYYRKAIKINPNFVKAHLNLANILSEVGDLKGAELSIRKAIELKPNQVDGHYNLGIILKELGKLKEAELSNRKAIELNPNLSKLHSNLASVLRELGDLRGAELATRKAIELNPNFANEHYNLGIILKDLGKLKDAELATRKAIKLNPDFAAAYSNLGGILKSLDNLQNAEILTRKAIELNPEYVEAYSNLGLILTDLGKLEGAQRSFRKAIELNPDYADAYFNLSLVELLKGNYVDGLENYEYRFKKKSPSIIHGNPIIRKKIDIDLLKGEKLLIVCEQGLGDTLHYMRYLHYLKNKGLDISFCPQLKLHSLIKSSNIDHNPLTQDQCCKISEGKWIPLLSISKLLGVNPKNPITTKPYIRARQELNYKWAEKLSNETLPIIGIHWQGSPEIEKNGYQGRSIPLETFGTLLKKNNIKFLSLQKGYGSEQLKHCSFRKHFVACQDEIDSILDFEEHAAIINSCDLVISNDSCAATLAGGMGKQVWLLLRDIPHWTWGLEKESTFWYPSMRLFRQKEKNNWTEVLERVSIEFEKINN
ncbi:tetratricopeptide repeat protein [Prochlorococcus marinus]|uniref:tetratricopeptide repeat protein n=1 Tax=Prochlorococcus marinus TaxID=1219 RepID=UPI0022B5DB7A|nr:tetratricopeptide repeat protein [Prochlorococcus marinus]